MELVQAATTAVLLLALTACQPGTALPDTGPRSYTPGPTSTTTATPTPTPTPMPTPTSTPPPPVVAAVPVPRGVPGPVRCPANRWDPYEGRCVSPAALARGLRLEREYGRCPTSWDHARQRCKTSGELQAEQLTVRTTTRATTTAPARTAAPTTTTVRPTPTTVAPTTAPRTTPPTPTTTVPSGTSTSSATSRPSTSSGLPIGYVNCDQVRRLGKAPVYRGQPGYGSHLDRDGDGIGCE